MISDVMPIMKGLPGNENSITRFSNTANVDRALQREGLKVF